MAIMSS